jgi:Calcineurin-like phosphoesterase
MMVALTAGASARAIEEVVVEENRRTFFKVAAGAVGVAVAASAQSQSVAQAQVTMGNIPEPGAVKGPVLALRARGKSGHRFVWMGDCCSGRPGERNERNFAAINKVLQMLNPMPEHVVFLGDNISGYTADEAELRSQWKYFLEKEFNFLDHPSIPVHHITSNHNTYSPMAEKVFRDVFPNLPKNGPVEQTGLSYWLRDGDLLRVMVNTSFSELGGDGHVETEWLDEVLSQNADARYKLVMGHHPAYPVNGYTNLGITDAGGFLERAIHGSKQVAGVPMFRWHILPDNTQAFWDVLTRHNVLAYVCSHIIAYDVQVRRGVLQVCTAGAGTNWGPDGAMPGATEYLHLLQGALDEIGLRYQVIDTNGSLREWLQWPVQLSAVSSWQPIPDGAAPALPKPSGWDARPGTQHALAFDFRGTLGAGSGEDQTLLSAWDDNEGPHILWVGLSDVDQRLELRMVPKAGDGDRVWRGPSLGTGGPLALQLLIHTGMGPGGVMYRTREDAPWTSLTTSCSRGAEAMMWPGRWAVGNGMSGPNHLRFRGYGLEARWYTVPLKLDLAA